jgi:hypothetical protein
MGHAWNAGFFSKIQKSLPLESNKRRLVLEAIVLIHNFCTEIVGSTQIKTVFDPECKHLINMEGYDRIRKYYLRLDNYGTDEEDKGIN